MNTHTQQTHSCHCIGASWLGGVVCCVDSMNNWLRWSRPLRQRCRDSMTSVRYVATLITLCLIDNRFLRADRHYWMEASDGLLNELLSIVFLTFIFIFRLLFFILGMQNWQIWVAHCRIPNKSSCSNFKWSVSRRKKSKTRLLLPSQMDETKGGGYWRVWRDRPKHVWTCN